MRVGKTTLRVIFQQYHIAKGFPLPVLLRFIQMTNKLDVYL